MGPHLIVHARWYMSVMLLEGHPIYYLYFIFDQSSFAQVQVPAGKQVLPFEQQLSGLFLLRFRPLSEALELQGLQESSSLAIAIGFLGSPCQEDFQWNLVGRHNLGTCSLCGDFNGMGVQVAQTDGYPSGPPM